MRIPTNKISDIAQYFRNELSSLYEKAEIERFIEYCFDEFAGLKKTDILLEPGRTVNESDLLKFSFAVKDLKRGRPIQYIIGKAWFYGMVFAVSPAVLIPRPETEELVSLVIAESSKHPESFSILDIGTGSGCIAIALQKKITRAHVYAADISPEALKIAMQNAGQHEAAIRFIESDVLDQAQWPHLPSCTFIVSNPPYVKYAEKSGMHANVVEHEPHTALFVPDEDALVFYKAIAAIGNLRLKPGGAIFVEINEALGLETCILFQKAGYTDVQMKQDLQGKDRFVVAKK
jgi:release factor glutamine methyltransferase